MNRLGTFLSNMNLNQKFYIIPKTLLHFQEHNIFY